ncbi:receptor-like protein 15 [Mangifera indica]|uniref:receptor-like protein 15 n=1 Tax=Mangifera indica TaxID=29780 RepID=UPI001CFB10AD|nr:receptor-like protein 15 [Mangifera indica]
MDPFVPESWVEGNSDCCEWERVECNNNTGRVIKLSLNTMTGLRGGNWYLNFSYLFAFDDLESLDLSSNSIVGFEGVERLSSRLGKLTILDLSSNKLNETNTTFQILSGFSSLKSLNLASNLLRGSIQFTDMRNLETLYMDMNPLNESFLQSMGTLSSLKYLSLSEALKDIAALPSEGWCDLKNLEELDLSRNELEGTIPSCLRNMTFLKLLDLSNNHFTGHIASSPLPHLTSLVYLSLSQNRLQIPNSFHSFANHSNLKVILGDENELIPETSFQTWLPKFQLITFSISNCRVGGLNITIPSFLIHQNDLRTLDLSYINFGGNFPSWLLKNNTKMERLFLRNNSFTGPFHLPSLPNLDIYLIDIYNNNFQGHIPANISSVFPNLRYIIMASNEFEGDIPPSLGHMTSLAFLDLSHNQLSGGIPQGMAMENSSLWAVKLSYNNLNGQILPTIFNSTQLQYFYVDGNNFVGNVPDISSNKILSFIDVSDNYFSGDLPKWIGNLSNLIGIDFSNNLLEGSIPVEFCKLDGIEFLYLSENNLSGSIPSCFSPRSARHVHLYKNRLAGPMTNAFNNSLALITLDLSYNEITGTIPSWLGNFPALSILLMKANRFGGNNIHLLCGLNRLTLLDLSQNYLSGSIPSCLSQLPFEESLEKSRTTVFTRGFLSQSMSLVALRESFNLKKLYPPHDSEYSYSVLDVQNFVDFTAKRVSRTYLGNILNLMNGIDLSENRLTGEIPREIGNITKIHALNLSHNSIAGSIPATFSNLEEIESLDLSYNKLNGNIPLELTELNNLAVFSVAHNNLSGATPERKGQFGTFDESSYEGNPYLCGTPLNKSCSETESRPSLPNDESEASGFIDMEFFYVSFAVSYTSVLLAIIAVLWINPRWRQAWFYFIESCIIISYIFCRKIVKN